MEFFVGVFIGLVVGWNFFPQPSWAKSLVDKAVDFVKSKFKKD